MTTVINLNIMNLFGLKFEKVSFDQKKAPARNDRERNSRHPGQGRVIDVTRHSRVVSDRESSEGKRDAVLPPDTPGRDLPTCRNNAIIKTYDCRGRAVHYLQAKGFHVDAYA